ncbi:uncharacterized protein DDB_G0290301-like [Haemorhous mexicanus]|uniref:uncharacterized protein DDB_G0290301-like n=1 Tax=Haemorhous mexicanus TaxID=30427 RepID=UPI0028BDC56A|nr:uncharacterized protein DDB_G0290301-like [Haemorhous mexicanus]
MLPPGLSGPMSEPSAVSALAPAAPGKDAKEEQTEVDDCQPPSVLPPGLSGPLLLEKEQEQTASPEMPCQTQAELFPAREQEEQLRQQVEEPEQNDQNIKADPQAELPEAQSTIMVVKRRNNDDMRKIQEVLNLHQQRGDQQKQVSERVAATPLMKHPLTCFLENMKQQLDTEFQKAHTRMDALEKRLEEEMKIIREKANRLPQALEKQVKVLTSHRAACEVFQQMSGNEPPQVWREAQISMGFVTKPAAAAALSKGAFASRPEKWSQGSLFTSRADPAAAQQQETEGDSLELLRRLGNPMENPTMKYTELEYIGSG